MGGRLHGVALGLGVMALAGCQTAPSGVSVESPTTSGISRVAFPAATDTGNIAAKLQELGLRVTQRNARFVEAVGDRGDDLVTCGTIRQTAFGNRTETSGTAPVAAIYTSQTPPALVVREFDSRSVVRVDVQDRGAVVQERHTITVRWETGSGFTYAPEQRTIRLGEAVRFSDGITCTTTGRVARSLR